LAAVANFSPLPHVPGGPLLPPTSSQLFHAQSLLFLPPKSKHCQHQGEFTSVVMSDHSDISRSPSLATSPASELPLIDLPFFDWAASPLRFCSEIGADQQQRCLNVDAEATGPQHLGILL